MIEDQERLMEQDQEVRQEVLDPECSFIVQAPAGSGKTELLTQRILRLLTRVEHPENILAITFTRKAAGEMRARLLESLRKADLDPCPEQPHLAQNWRLARAVLEHDRQQGWNLIQHPNRLEIRTMDSFNARLVRQMPLLSGFGGMPAVTDDAEELYRGAARATLQMVEDEALGEPIAVLLRWLDNDAVRVERMVTEMLGQRDQWLPHIISGQLNREALQLTLCTAVESTLQQLSELLQRELGDTAVTTLTGVISRAAAIVVQSDKPFEVVHCVGMESLPSAEAEALPLWQGIASMLLKSDGGFRLTPRSWNRNHGLPPTEEGKADKEALLQLSRQISESSAAVWVQKLMLLPPVTYEEGQWELIEALFRVLLLAQANLMLEFESQGVVDHTEIAQRALHALGSDESPTALGLRLDYQIHHLLVDEFQDTSHGQFDLLSRLTAEWEQDRSRTLFLVGDPMQSIYRFRHAEVGLFIKAIEEGVGALRLEYRQLSANFRSESGVVDWVNRTFDPLFPRQANRFSGAVSYAASISTRLATTGEAVTLHPQLEDDREAEAHQVCTLIRQTLEECGETGQVAILVRSRPHLQQITEQLYRSGIAYRAVEIESLGDRPLIRDLLTLTRALLHQGDREAWLALLRGPWCGLSLQDLLGLVDGFPERTIWSLLGEDAVLERISDAGKRRLIALKIVLEQIFQARGEQSLVRWIEQGWLLLGAAALHRQLGEAGQSIREERAYFELFSEMEQGGELVDLSRLQQRLLQKNLRSEADAEQEPRVEVMTIHKSKGLQFDTVILPGLGRKPRVSESRLLHWLEVPQQMQIGTETMQLLLSPVRASSQRAEEDRLGRYVRQIEQEREWNELSRLLYVAVTRAERRVHLLGAGRVTTKGGLGKPAARSLLEQLWPALEVEYQQLLEQSDADTLLETGGEEQSPVQPAALRLQQPWQLPVIPQPSVPLSSKPQPQSVYQWGASSAIHIGTVVHAQLQWIAEQGVEQWMDSRLDQLEERVVSQLRQLGVAEERRLQAARQVLEALQKVLDDPQGCLFLADHAEAKSEWSLSALLDGELVHVTIDRTFVDAEGVRWIVDWKSSSHSGGGLEQFLDSEVERYTPQLQRYGAVLRQMENRPQKLVLYFPMHQVMREVEAV